MGMGNAECADYWRIILILTLWTADCARLQKEPGALVLHEESFIPLVSESERAVILQKYKNAKLPPVELVQRSYQNFVNGDNLVKHNASLVYFPEWEFQYSVVDLHEPMGRLAQLDAAAVQSGRFSHRLRDSIFWPQAQATGDVCNLPQVIGTGPYRIPRWHFNPSSRRCELYYYSGCCGNGNNFPSPEACQVLCEGKDSMCLLPLVVGRGPYRIPRWYYNSFSRQCESFYYTGCYGNQNNFPALWLCKEVCEVDPCTQPRDPGVGSLQIRRYYFNQDTKLCEEFTYFGSGGNRNNYATLEACRSTCPESPNPCSLGDPMRDGTGGALRCGFSLVVTNTCPPNYYCHVGASPTTTLCCPVGNQAQCEQRVREGVGSEQLLRWHFDPTSQQCRQFTYKGLQGNQNNFLSQADCENACFVNPCSVGQPFKSGTTLFQCSSATPGSCPDVCTIDTCPLCVSCNIRVSFASFVLSLGTQRPDRCGEAMNEGQGTAQLARWFFDRSRQDCQRFIYKGLQGNSNNFLTKEECEQRCPVFQNPCAAGAAGRDGTGRPLFCDRAGTAPSTCPTNFYCHIGASPDSTVCCPSTGNACTMPLSEGVGTTALRRFYFDSSSRSCLPFTYRGTQGNANNFVSEEACAQQCPVFVNPCPGFAAAFSGIPPSCSKTQSCAPGFWCHVGSSEDTTVCCRGGENACSLPKADGSGSANLPRFYYDSTSRQCTQFYYRGLYGNANSFLTKATCESQCPTWTNACARGQPLLGGDNRPLRCSSTEAFSCPPTFYCHVGANADTTMCCSGGEDPCAIPNVEGEGFTNIQRWFYDYNTRSCKNFGYRGLKGNPNNFLTREDCEKRCPVWENPCATGQPLLNAVGRPEACVADGATGTSSCPVTHWCHVGVSSETTVCCPGRGDPCQYALAEGAGMSALSRWYFDASSRSCRQFSYRGTNGNQNNFQSLTACEARCPVFKNPCPTPIAINDVRFCSALNTASCAPGFWCHLGDSDQTTLCCPNDNGEQCTQPISQGSGTSSLPRWYYDATDRSCRSFTYSGIGGNQNNFISKNACETACPVWTNPCVGGDPMLQGNRPRSCSADNPCPRSHWCHLGAEPALMVCCPTPRDPCIVPMVQGSGTAALDRWYFDSGSRQCLPFVYRGLAGNQNNFLSKSDCEAVCPVFRNPCSTGPVASDASGKPIQCSLGGQLCQEGFWCHFGDQPQTTVCCPNAANPCEQPRNEGQGSANLSRWYFNRVTQHCENFLYRGILGSQNNFLSQNECETQCPVFQNPCPTGEPPRDPATNRMSVCSAVNPSCPTGYWCHVSATPESTVCCPGVESPCDMPKMEGSGNGALSRWYFNNKALQCESFVYRGTRGNQNNFVSQSQCEQRCPVFRNPCSGGQPAKLSSGLPRFCSQLNPNCPTGFWCHYGGSDDTTVCCPGVEDPCTQLVSTGTGTMSLSRWYYSGLTKTCSSFVYSGVMGNRNNFLSQQLCEQACPVFQNPCPNGEPLVGSDRKPISCQFGNNSCGSSYWCHLGAVPETTVCCPGAFRPCEQSPMAAGTGTSSSSRWSYNAQQRQCFMFSYWGLRGNQNNFLSRQDCEMMCPAFQEACDRFSSDTGMGNGTLARWYFDAQTKQCRSFVYKGLRGNANNFLSKDDCEKTCPVWKNPCVTEVSSPRYCSKNNPFCPVGQWCHLGSTTELTVCCSNAANNICNLPLEQGQGNEALPRFYFNPSQRLCVAFTYKGTKGNQNSFLTREDCETLCPVFVNPCSTGEPLYDPSGKPQQCNRQSPLDSCPRGYWCHVGENDESTVCCSGARDPCTLSVDTGRGLATLPRWYFNPSVRRCTPFTYSGLRGNQNNFLSSEMCSRVCREIENPCVGQPALNPNGQVIFCSKSNKENCPVNFWCHVGASPESTMCCPGATNPCSVPLSPGTGSQKLTRFYYNSDSRQCVEFTYSGLNGNQNNFLTLDECQATCPVWMNPCVGGPPATAGGQKPLQCTPGIAGSCPHGYWCHNGATSQDSVCCPGFTDNVCSLPKTVGNGPSRLARWFFDNTQRRCTAFNYSGRDGNQNNFVSKEECLRSCPEFDNPCAVGDVLMQHDGIMPMACEPGFSMCPEGFFCHVGSLRSVCCRMMQEFEDPCGAGQAEKDEFGNPRICHPFLPLQCSVGYFCHSGDLATSSTSHCCPAQGNPCSSKKIDGEGGSNLQRFYFNPSSNECEMFFYRGKKGNQNNFLSREQCQRECIPDINPCFLPDEPFKEKGRNLLCQAGVQTSCPPTHYCHIGVDQYSTVCCPRRGAACDQPPLIGQPGVVKLPRWYFDRDEDGCMPFTYSGMGGNENNFGTREQCEASCPGYRSYCPHSRPLLIAGEPATCGVETACPNNNYVCHINTQKSVSVCCPDPAWFCILPRDPGRCSNYTTQYGYNRETGTCTPFQYGGCGGNLNRFKSLEHCTSVCCDKGF